MGRPSTARTSRSGSAVAPWVVTVWPLTVTRPSAISRSLARREASPASARILLSRFSTDDDGRWLALGGRRRPGQIPLRLGQLGEIAEPEGDQELARGLVEERTPRGVLAPCDPDQAAVQEALEDGG